MARKNRNPKNPAHSLTWDEAIYLLGKLFENGRYRHSAYVKLAITFGFRFVDTSRIRWGDILRSRTGVYETTEQKTGKQIRKTIESDLREHISACWQALNCPDMREYILTSQKSGKITSVQSMNMTAKNTWIPLYDLKIEPKNFSTHSFRKTSAKRIYNKYGLIAAKNWLNHADTKVTERYLLLKEDEILKLTTV